MSQTENITSSEGQSSSDEEHHSSHPIIGEGEGLQSFPEESDIPVESPEAIVAAEEEISHELKQEPQKGDADKEPTPAVAEFLKKLVEAPDAVAKLQLAVDFMQESISQSGNPQFRNFWEARRHCLALFKENISPTIRTQLWTKYRELSDEARRLKEILDEQTAFATEQIDVAITALEQDIAQTKDLVARQAEVTFPAIPRQLEGKDGDYKLRQQELNLLNAFATRINVLRKELIKTDMRIRNKNKFFKRLSVTGDLVFPRRKELIKETSQHFIDDVDAFVSACKADPQMGRQLFFYREEIKALQGVAKSLTLNTQAFTSTRAKLSECWDQIKLLEKDRKKEQAQKRQTFKQNSDLIQDKIKQFSDTYAAGGVSLTDATKQLDDIAAEMRKSELGRQDIAALRDALNAARKPIFDKIREKENERHAEEEARERQHRENIQAVRQRIETVIAGAASFDAETLASERDKLQEEITRLRCSRPERIDLERLLKPLRDVVSDKQEQALLTLPADAQAALEQLYEVLRQRKERRREIKEQLEQLRKAGKTSGLDFEQAIVRSELINSEKERLEKANQSIEEVERQIEALENNDNG